MSDATTGRPVGPPTDAGSLTPSSGEGPSEQATRTAGAVAASSAVSGAGSPDQAVADHTLAEGTTGQVGTGNRRRRGSRGRRGRGGAGGSTAPGPRPETTSGQEVAGPGDERAPVPGVVPSGAPAPVGGPVDVIASGEGAGTRMPMPVPDAAPVERPKIGDSRPARPPVTAPVRPAGPAAPEHVPNGGSRSRRRGGGSGGGGAAGTAGTATQGASAPRPTGAGRGATVQAKGGATPGGDGRKGGRERRGKAVGRYMICVHVRPEMTQIALLEGRTLVEHYISRAADDATQIDGNIYRGRVQNVLPGMEAAFIDIGTPKNAVLYHGDVRFDTEDVETPKGSGHPRIEHLLKPGQTILCQVTKNPIGAKGARLTQEVSLPGRFVVLVPNSTAYGISKRLDDGERKRLRRIVDAVRPQGHGLIVRTAAAGASAEELEADIARLVDQWDTIAAAALKGQGPALLYREPAIAVRVIREELNREYRAVVIDDETLYEQVRDYVGAVNPELADRVEFFDPEVESLPVFERYHVHEQLHKALDRKVFLPSGGSLVIDRTEALTVIDVNTGKNVGTTNLEETVYRNNLEAAEEVARQLRLRDIGGIIVIDFIDMEIRENRDKVGSALRSALARDKTRTQVSDISELGLVEMTRKRVSEGLIESMSTTCEVCGGRGIVFDDPEL